nr:translation initiation factor IF-2-like [Anser cygnoides]
MRPPRAGWGPGGPLGVRVLVRSQKCPGVGRHRAGGRAGRGDTAQPGDPRAAAPAPARPPPPLRVLAVPFGGDCGACAAGEPGGAAGAPGAAAAGAGAGGAAPASSAGRGPPSAAEAVPASLDPTALPPPGGQGPSPAWTRWAMISPGDSSLSVKVHL